MIPYLLVAAVVPALIGVSQRVFRGPRAQGQLRWLLLSPFELVATGILVCFAGLRYGIGTDYEIYSYIFVRLDATSWQRTIANSPQESGFTVLSLLIKSVSENPDVFFFVTSALTVLCAVVAIYLASPSRSVSIAAYILLAHYTGPMNTVRQGLATSMLFLAFVLYNRRSSRSPRSPRSPRRTGSSRNSSHAGRPWAVIVAVLACTIHFSAIIAIVFFAVARVITLTRTTLAVMVAVAGASASAIALLPPIQNLLALFGDRYVFYVDHAQGAGFGTVLSLAFQCAVALFLLQIRLSAPFLIWMRNIYMFGPLFTIIGLSFLEATRIAGYFSMVLVLLAPHLFDHLKGRPVMKAAVVVAATGYFVADLLNYGGLIPYEWIFNAQS
ncbi:MAG: EpsG family protein [Ancrocorticia sp.]|uniref:EpsG family protein n=1 Tax=Ancrocorticia sp. TaxID=2593684 RepID=UPI003F904AA2